LKKIISLVLILFSAVVFAQDWQPTYTEALTCAKKNNIPLILVFSGSDWCAPCIKLDRSIWQSDDFKAYAKDNYVLYRADFPRKKNNKLSKVLSEQNSELADRFNPKGHFPLVVILNTNEKELGTTGYKKIAPKEYISLLNTFIK
jgi:thioredoxin-related protein